ncbi:MAG: TnpV protein [Oscillibacter sp.]|nr:TnpV protein [Oscillibacter sp.]
MELTYTKVGDYYIPDLALDDDTEYEIGIYGRSASILTIAPNGPISQKVSIAPPGSVTVVLPSAKVILILAGLERFRHSCKTRSFC